MTPSEQVEYESRTRMRYALIAFVGGVLLVAAQFVSLSGSHPDVAETTLNLISVAAHDSQQILSGVLNSLALIALGLVLVWLFSITKQRRPQMRNQVLWFLIAGIVLGTVGMTVRQFVFVHVAHQFMHTSELSYPQANHLTNSGGVFAVELLVLLSDVLIGFTMFMILLNSLRVGLFGRGVAYTGLAAAALLLIANLFATGVALFAYLQPLLQGIWMVLAAVIFAKRWPGGEYPAWREGIAVPWQPLQSQSQPRGRPSSRAADTVEPRSRRPRDAQRASAQQQADSDQPQVSPTAGTPKRKRRR